MSKKKTLRIAAMSDLHYGRQSEGQHRELLAQASEAADVLLICGDMTDYGQAEEAEHLAHDIRTNVRVPVLAVFGNHDFESGTPEDVRAVLENAGVRVLDGECTEVDGVGFAGVRGFGGGFDRYALSPWGEPTIKQFVQEAVEEELKLETALSRMKAKHRVVLLHYAPIRATVEGEPPEIFPFLGSSRLEEPLNRYEVAAAFHGHAHLGAAEGETSRGVPVFNVSIPVLKRAYPDQPPFRIFELELDGDEE
jgi:Icc-related predicted phosphoesterase